jgi:hypothetical protein
MVSEQRTLASLAAEVAILRSHVAELKHLHAERNYLDGLAVLLLRKNAELLGRVMLADEALIPADVRQCADDVWAVWMEMSA